MNLSSDKIFKLTAPPSKSDAIRRVAAACLFGPADLYSAIPLSADVRAALSMAEAIGAKIKIHDGLINIEPPPKIRTNALIQLNAGESALALNLFAVIASFYAANRSITLNGSLARRKFDSGDVLSRFGISCARRGDEIEFSGEFTPVDYTFESEESNQMISAIAFGAAARGASCRLSHPRLASVGYLRMTCDALREYGFKIEFSDAQTYIHKERIPIHGKRSISIEGDWSSAAFFLVSGAFFKPVMISGLNADSSQPDRSIVEILHKAGANVYFDRNAVCVRPSRALRSFETDLAGAPDLFPPVAALALYCNGTTVLKGARRLKNKESDRAAALVEEFTKLGGDLELVGGDLVIRGGVKLTGGQINVRGDHRIAMAALVAGLRTSGMVRTDDQDCIGKSYPAFLHDYSTFLSFD